jgi:hypothetical protein
MIMKSFFVSGTQAFTPCGGGPGINPYRRKMFAMQSTTQKEVASFLRINRRTFAEWQGEGCPGTAGSYPLDEIVAWAKANKWCRSDDPLLAGGDSPALEEYRRQRAELARMDVAERKKNLLKRDEIEAFLMRFCGILRGAGERLQRSHGATAHAILDKALDDCDALISSEFCSPEDDDS